LFSGCQKSFFRSFYDVQFDILAPKNLKVKNLLKKACEKKI